jgi:hypothetical protein
MQYKNFNFYWENFEEISNIKFQENLSSGTRVNVDGRIDEGTGTYDEANSHFSQFCESSWKKELPLVSPLSQL